MRRGGIWGKRKTTMVTMDDIKQKFLAPIGRNLAFVFIVLILGFTGYSVMNIAEYKGVFSEQPDDLPNTAEALKANADDVQKVSVVIDYPHFKVTGSLIQDHKTLGMWSQAGDAHQGDVAVEMKVDLRGVYDFDSKNVSKSDCEAIRDNTPSWSDNWHKLVPGCGFIDNADINGTIVKFAGDAYSPENDADFYQDCYEQMKMYNDLQSVLFWVWLVFLVGYGTALFMQRKNRKSESTFTGGVGEQLVGVIFVMIMLLVYIILFSMLVNSGHKLYGSKNTCFMKTINTAIAGATYGDDDTSVAAYKWDDLKKYNKGEMFGPADGTPALKVQNITADHSYGEDKKAARFDVTILALSCVAFISTLINALMSNCALFDGTRGGFSDGFIM